MLSHSKTTASTGSSTPIGSGSSSRNTFDEPNALPADPVPV